MKIFRNRTVIGVLCILLALIICFGVTPLFSRSASEKTEIVRVTKDIKEGDEITAEMVQTVEVGAYNLPQNLMTDKKEIVGKYATADLAVGDYILSSKLSTVPAAENAYLYNLDGTKQAISVTIKSFATGLSGKLESGDIVTVIVADYQGKGETAIPPELQYVEVISVTASSGYDANTGEVVDEKELPSTVTLLVTTEQAKVLAELEQDSELHLALVYRGTPENAAKFIAAQDALIEELYAEPEPENSAKPQRVRNLRKARARSLPRKVRPPNEFPERQPLSPQYGAGGAGADGGVRRRHPRRLGQSRLRQDGNGSQNRKAFGNPEEKYGAAPL